MINLFQKKQNRLRTRNFKKFLRNWDLKNFKEFMLLNFKLSAMFESFKPCKNNSILFGFSKGISDTQNKTA